MQTGPLLIVCAVLIPVAYGIAGSLLPPPTDFFRTQGLSYFRPTFLRYSQTVEVYSPTLKLYWSVDQHPVSEHYSIQGTKTRGRKTLFEMIDAGTFSNIPRNTRPRHPEYLDDGTQHFFVRFNESFILRSIDLNKYVGTIGTGWQSRVTLVDDITVAEVFRVLPVLKMTDPNIQRQQIATNTNLDDNVTNVMNGSKVHLLNNQLNYYNVVEGVTEVLSQGPGRKQLGLWETGDVFQVLHQKQLEG